MSVFLKNLAVPVNGATPLPLAFPEPVAQATAVLAGFTVNFQNSQHFLKELKAKVVSSPNSSVAPFTSLLISGEAYIKDKDPNHLSGGALNGMVLASTPNDDSLHYVEFDWNRTGSVTVDIRYLTRPLSQVAIFLRGITIETKDTDFEVTSLTADAGNSTVELGEYREDSMGYSMQRVFFEPKLKLEKRDGKSVDFKTATLSLTVVGICAPV